MGNERVVELDQYEFNTVITLINEKRNNMIKVHIEKKKRLLKKYKILEM